MHFQGWKWNGSKGYWIKLIKPISHSPHNLISRRTHKGLWKSVQFKVRKNVFYHLKYNQISRWIVQFLILYIVQLKKCCLWMMDSVQLNTVNDGFCTIEHCLWLVDYVQLNIVSDWWIMYNWTLLVTDGFCNNWTLLVTDGFCNNWTLLVTDGFCTIEHC